MALDVFEYLNQLELERYRAIIIHTIPSRSELLSKFILKVCKKVEGKYIDLLEAFISTSDLNENIEYFGPDEFKEYLIKESKSESTLIIDRADFILDTWKKSERRDFFQMIDDQWDGFKERMRAKIIICLQTSQEIENLKIMNSLDEKRVLKLEEFNDI